MPYHLRRLLPHRIGSIDCMRQMDTWVCLPSVSQCFPVFPCCRSRVMPRKPSTSKRLQHPRRSASSLLSQLDAMYMTLEPTQRTNSSSNSAMGWTDA